MNDSIKILIVEDEAIIANTIKIVLEKYGFNIIGVAYNYKTALSHIENSAFDILITDIDLGYGTDQQSGIQIAEELKKIKTIPFIFLTAYDDIATIKQATSLKPAGYLSKPLNAATLYATLEIAIENFYKNKIAATEAITELPNYIYIKTSKGNQKVMWADVVSLQSTKNYVKLLTLDKQHDLLIRSSLQQVVQQMLPAQLHEQFIKINRGQYIQKSIVLKKVHKTIYTNVGEFECTEEVEM